MTPKPKTFSVHDYLVSFGPKDTIVASCPNDIFFHNIDVSENLSKILDHAEGVNAVAYPSVAKRATASQAGMTDSQRQAPLSVSELVLTDEISDPYVAYSRKSRMVGSHHEMYQPSTTATIPALETWLDDRLSQSSIQIVSNALGGWWASSASGEVGFGSITPALQQLLKPSNADGKVIHVAMGINDSFVAIFENGEFQWDLKNAYPDLDAYMQGKKANDLIYVSLDPFRAGRYFAAFSDATVLYKLPESATELENALIDAEDLRVILFSDTVRHSTITLPQNRSVLTTFVDETAGIVKAKVEETVAEGLVEGALTVAAQLADD